MKKKLTAQSAPARRSLSTRRSFTRRLVGEGGFFSSRTLLILLLCTAAAGWLLSGTLLAFFHPDASAKVSQRVLTFAERVAFQRAIEEVYWRHRIWPKERPDPKPSLDAMMPQSQVEKKVTDYLRNSRALVDYWQRTITAEQLQAEMDRMAHHTKQPEVLHELFEALGNDPCVVAECLARPILSERLTADFSAQTERVKSDRLNGLANVPIATTAANGAYTLPQISEAYSPCVDDTWSSTSITNAPDGRMVPTAVWTGSEMIVWGGTTNRNDGLDTGGRYNPSTDSWAPTSITNAPDGRFVHTAVWTGSEMIVWGGNGATHVNTGGRYNPTTDTWIATSTTNAPIGRELHTAVWTGKEMIVWGGVNNITNLNTGGRYIANTDSWTATSTTNAPTARFDHTAVWTGGKMIVWGGFNGGSLNTGGQYDPSTDSWTATSTSGAPSARYDHTAIWSGSKMIVWGGDNPSVLNTGGRYDPGTNSWTATSSSGAPAARYWHTAVWTGTEMIVWGGTDDMSAFNTGGRYCAQSGPTPTPTPTATPTPSETPTPTPTPAAPPRVTPRPRPTPHPRL